MPVKNIIGVDVKNKKVLFRPDINSPIDGIGKITSYKRLEAVAPTLKYLLDGGAGVAIIAHQGDTLDYQNLMPLTEHAEILSKLTGYKISYMDDICGDSVIDTIKNMKFGEAYLLGNLRYLTEEVSTFEKDVKLTAAEYCRTYLVRRLAPLFDIYVNEAFSAAHRNAPSMVAFQESLPSYAGPLFFKEYSTLSKVMTMADKPNVFLLGGAKISDAFGMMGKVLKEGIADFILTGGVTGEVMRIAEGYKFGNSTMQFLKNKDLLGFVKQAEELLADYKDRFIMPIDFAYDNNGVRSELELSDLPKDNLMFMDIGHKTIKLFSEYIAKAGTILVNGPMGVYENTAFADGTKEVFKALADTSAYTVIGGGDTVASAGRFIDISKIDYVCTAGGAMVQFLSGKKLPLIEAMENSK